jgi:integrase
MKLKLDQKTVAGLALEAGRNEDFAWDTELEGFGLRLRRGAKKLRRTYVAQYRKNGRTRRMTIGLAERLTPAEAREGARRILARVSLDGDPQAEKAAKRVEAARTFRLAVEAFLAARKNELKPGSFYHAKLYLTGSYFRMLHPMPVNGISRSDVAAQISALFKVRAAPTIQSARDWLSSFFQWAMGEGWADINPVIGTRKLIGPPPRTRVLTDAELVAIWRAVQPDEPDPRRASDHFTRRVRDFCCIIRLLILLGSRRSEIGGMRFREFDLDAGTWTLPAERSKNSRALTIILPPVAYEIVRAAFDSRQQDGERDCLFGTESDGGFARWSFSKTALDQRLGKAVKPWRIHDIRRTVATRMADIGIQPHIIEAVLNHYSGHRAGVAGVYNRSPYEREVKTALLRWSEHVLALVEGREESTVVAFPA